MVFKFYNTDILLQRFNTTVKSKQQRIFTVIKVLTTFKSYDNKINICKKFEPTMSQQETGNFFKGSYLEGWQNEDYNFLKQQFKDHIYITFKICKLRLNQPK